MFDDVSVTIIDSIKKASDVGNMFTAYTQQFKLPASKTNNQIFKRFSSFKVLNGYDARRKHAAIIKLNGANFQPGYFKLNEVELKDGDEVAFLPPFAGG